jgi:hypothetical protein
VAEFGEGEIHFRGGGAMNEIEKDGEWFMSWTPVDGDTDVFVEDFGYDFVDVIEKVKNL